MPVYSIFMTFSNEADVGLWPLATEYWNYS